jgi:hypothetical protein
MVAQDVADAAARERIVERYARAAFAAIVEAEAGELDETGDLVQWVRGALAVRTSRSRSAAAARAAPRT